MSDLSKKPPPNHAAPYCAMYPELARIAREHGYALAIHGSMGRDFDLVAVPWLAAPSPPIDVVDAFCQRYAIRIVPRDPEHPNDRPRDPTIREHGREVWQISLAWGDCYIDLSFTPRAAV